MNAPDYPIENETPSKKTNDLDRFSSPYGEGFTVKKDLNVRYGKRGDHLVGGHVSKMGEMMHHCLDRCEKSDVVNICIDRGGWMLIAPYAIGIVLFLVGWFLSAEAVRVLWLLISGLIAVVGLITLVMANLIIRDRSKGDSVKEH